MNARRMKENPFRLHLRLWVLCALGFCLVEASLSARVGPAELFVAMGQALASVPPFDSSEAPWGYRLEDSVVRRLRALGYLVPDAP